MCHVASNDWHFSTQGCGGLHHTANGGAAGGGRRGGGPGCVQSPRLGESASQRGCCFQGYSDMRANCRCQADSNEAQLETPGEGR